MLAALYLFPTSIPLQTLQPIVSRNGWTDPMAAAAAGNRTDAAAAVVNAAAVDVHVTVYSDLA